MTSSNRGINERETENPWYAFAFPWRLITFVYSLLLHAFMSTHCFAMVESGRVNPTVQVPIPEVLAEAGAILTLPLLL